MNKTKRPSDSPKNKKPEENRHGMIEIEVELRVAEWTDYGTDKSGDSGLRVYPEYPDHPDEDDSMFPVEAGLLILEGELLRSIIRDFNGTDQLSESLTKTVGERTVRLSLCDGLVGDDAREGWTLDAELYDTTRFSENDISHEFLLRDPGTGEQVGLFELNEAKLLEEPDVDWDTEEWTLRIADHEQSE